MVAFFNHITVRNTGIVDATQGAMSFFTTNPRYATKNKRVAIGTCPTYGAVIYIGRDIFDTVFRSTKMFVEMYNAFFQDKTSKGKSYNLQCSNAGVRYECYSGTCHTNGERLCNANCRCTKQCQAARIVLFAKSAPTKPGDFMAKAKDECGFVTFDSPNIRDFLTFFVTTLNDDGLCYFAATTETSGGRSTSHKDNDHGHAPTLVAVRCISIYLYICAF